jgi:hypothetical protein
VRRARIRGVPRRIAGVDQECKPRGALLSCRSPHAPLALSAADPLNLEGVLTPGERLLVTLSSRSSDLSQMTPGHRVRSVRWYLVPSSEGPA